jgi:hypothetical protein
VPRIAGVGKLVWGGDEEWSLGRDQLIVDVADRLPEETALVNPALAFEAGLPPLVELFTAAPAKAIGCPRVVPERPNIGVHVKE